MLVCVACVCMCVYACVCFALSSAPKSSLFVEPKAAILEPLANSSKVDAPSATPAAAENNIAERMAKLSSGPKMILPIAKPVVADVIEAKPMEKSDVIEAKPLPEPEKVKPELTTAERMAKLSGASRMPMPSVADSTQQEEKAKTVEVIIISSSLFSTT